jgi:hypothetical protein
MTGNDSSEGLGPGCELKLLAAIFIVESHHCYRLRNEEARFEPSF